MKNIDIEKMKKESVIRLIKRYVQEILQNLKGGKTDEVITAFVNLGILLDTTKQNINTFVPETGFVELQKDEMPSFEIVQMIGGLVHTYIEGGFDIGTEQEKKQYNQKSLYYTMLKNGVDAFLRVLGKPGEFASNTADMELQKPYRQVENFLTRIINEQLYFVSSITMNGEGKPDVSQDFFQNLPENQLPLLIKNQTTEFYKKDEKKESFNVLYICKKDKDGKLIIVQVNSLDYGFDKNGIPSDFNGAINLTFKFPQGEVETINFCELPNEVFTLNNTSGKHFPNKTKMKENALQYIDQQDLTKQRESVKKFFESAKQFFKDYDPSKETRTLQVLCSGLNMTYKQARSQEQNAFYEKKLEIFVAQEISSVKESVQNILILEEILINLYCCQNVLQKDIQLFWKAVDEFYLSDRGEKAAQEFIQAFKGIFSKLEAADESLVWQRLTAQLLFYVGSILEKAGGLKETKKEGIDIYEESEDNSPIDMLRVQRKFSVLRKMEQEYNDKKGVLKQKVGEEKKRITEETDAIILFLSKNTDVHLLFLDKIRLKYLREYEVTLQGIESVLACALLEPLDSLENVEKKLENLMRLYTPENITSHANVTYSSLEFLKEIKNFQNISLQSETMPLLLSRQIKDKLGEVKNISAIQFDEKEDVPSLKITDDLEKDVKKPIRDILETKVGQKSISNHLKSSDASKSLRAAALPFTTLHPSYLPVHTPQVTSPSALSRAQTWLGGLFWGGVGLGVAVGAVGGTIGGILVLAGIGKPILTIVALIEIPIIIGTVGLGLGWLATKIASAVLEPKKTHELQSSAEIEEEVSPEEKEIITEVFKFCPNSSDAVMKLGTLSSEESQKKLKDRLASPGAFVIIEDQVQGTHFVVYPGKKTGEMRYFNPTGVIPPKHITDLYPNIRMDNQVNLLKGKGHQHTASWALYICMELNKNQQIPTANSLRVLDIQLEANKQKNTPYSYFETKMDEDLVRLKGASNIHILKTIDLSLNSAQIQIALVAAITSVKEYVRGFFIPIKEKDGSYTSVYFPVGLDWKAKKSVNEIYFFNNTGKLSAELIQAWDILSEQGNKTQIKIRNIQGAQVTIKSAEEFKTPEEVFKNIANKTLKLGSELPKKKSTTMIELDESSPPSLHTEPSSDDEEKSIAKALHKDLFGTGGSPVPKESQTPPPSSPRKKI